MPRCMRENSDRVACCISIMSRSSRDLLPPSAPSLAMRAEVLTAAEKINACGLVPEAGDPVGQIALMVGLVELGKKVALERDADRSVRYFQSTMAQEATEQPSKNSRMPFSSELDALMELLTKFQNDPVAKNIRPSKDPIRLRVMPLKAWRIPPVGADHRRSKLYHETRFSL